MMKSVDRIEFRDYKVSLSFQAPTERGRLGSGMCEARRDASFRLFRVVVPFGPIHLLIEEHNVER